MTRFELTFPSDFDGWRASARSAIQSGIAPDAMTWTVKGAAQSELFDDLQPRNATEDREHAGRDTPVFATNAFLTNAKHAICHSDPERFSLTYRLLWRLQSNHQLLKNIADHDVIKFNRLAKDVRRDCHKMRAFVRFRKVESSAAGREAFVAWFEPSHHITRLTAPFFRRRFANMDWSILTPEVCAHWDGIALTFTAGVCKTHAPEGDALEDYWRSYFKSIFNPARLKISAMQAEMPKKYWRNLPETELIPALIREAQSREASMIGALPTEPNAARMRHRHRPAPEPQVAHDEINDLDTLNKGLKSCAACPLARLATQPVFGAGDPHASIMLVGEQPGDQEDIAGRPFLGPAGKILDEVLADANVQRDDIYLTNAVKHFKYTVRGKRRLHQRPNTTEIDHCRWWLMKEIELVRPRVIVALGATAVRSLTGETRSLTKWREVGAHVLPYGPTMIVTCHPSFVLRSQSTEVSQQAKQTMIDDMMLAQALSAGKDNDRAAISSVAT